MNTFGKVSLPPSLLLFLSLSLSARVILMGDDRLSASDQAALRQRLAPLFEQSRGKAMNLLTCVAVVEASLLMQEESDPSLADRNLSIDSTAHWTLRKGLLTRARASLRETVSNSADDAESADMAAHGEGGEPADSNLQQVLRMNLSKKEAQSKLSPQEFKLWKKAQRYSRKKDEDDES